MQLISFLSEYVASALDVVLIWIFLNSFYKIRKNTNLGIKMMLLVSMFLCAQFLSNYFFVQTALLYVFILLIERITFQEKIRIQLILPCVIIIGMFLGNILVINLVAMVSGLSYGNLTQMAAIERIIVLLLSKVVFAIFLWAVNFIFGQNNKKLIFENKFLIVMYMSLTITITCFVKIFTETKSADFNKTYLIVGSFMLLIIMCGIFLNNQGIVNAELKANGEVANDETRIFKHDYKKYFSIVLGLIHIGEVNEAAKQIDYIIGEKLDIQNVANEESKLLNTVINEKYSICSKKNIQLRVSVISGEVELIDNIDVAVMISNLIDNAIEAEEKNSINKMIEVKLFQNGNFLNIIVKNIIEESVLKTNPEMRTGKKDKKMHGIGLDSIKKVSEKFAGKFVCLEDGEWFVAHVMLNVNELKQKNEY